MPAGRLYSDSKQSRVHSSGGCGRDSISHFSVVTSRRGKGDGEQSGRCSGRRLLRGGSGARRGGPARVPTRRGQAAAADIRSFACRHRDSIAAAAARDTASAAGGRGVFISRGGGGGASMRRACQRRRRRSACGGTLLRRIAGPCAVAALGPIFARR
jgi:hypothetical protein